MPATMMQSAGLLHDVLAPRVKVDVHSTYRFPCCLVLSAWRNHRALPSVKHEHPGLPDAGRFLTAGPGPGPRRRRISGHDLRAHNICGFGSSKIETVLFNGLRCLPPSWVADTASSKLKNQRRTKRSIRPRSRGHPCFLHHLILHSAVADSLFDGHSIHACREWAHVNRSKARSKLLCSCSEEKPPAGAMGVRVFYSSTQAA